MVIGSGGKPRRKDLGQGIVKKNQIPGCGGRNGCEKGREKHHFTLDREIIKKERKKGILQLKKLKNLIMRL